MTEQDWEQRKLGDVTDVRDGTHDSPKYFNEGYPLITSKNLKNDGLDMDNVSLISEEDFNKFNKRSKVHKGDILFGMIGTIGNPVLINREDFAIKNVALIKQSNAVLNVFIIQLLKSPVFNSYINRENAGGTQKFLSLSKIRDFSFKSPALKEQNTIYKFLSNLDKNIALHQRKINILEKINLEFLKKMFPDYNQDSLNLRFRDFKENWERKKLIQVVQSAYQGINTAADKVKYSSIGVPILQAKHITNGKISFKEARYLDKENYQYYFPKYAPKNGDILFANIGTIGTSLVVKTSQEFLIAWNILKITLKNDTDSRFVQTYLTLLRNRNFFESITTGNATKFINKDEVLKIQLPLPLIDEQETIGRFIYEIDDIIKNHQVKINQLNVLKKIYLRKIFL